MRPVKNRKWRKRIRVLCAWALIALLCCPSLSITGNIGLQGEIGGHSQVLAAEADAGQENQESGSEDPAGDNGAAPQNEEGGNNGSEDNGSEGGNNGSQGNGEEGGSDDSGNTGDSGSEGGSGDSGNTGSEGGSGDSGNTGSEGSGTDGKEESSGTPESPAVPGGTQGGTEGNTGLPGDTLIPGEEKVPGEEEEEKKDPEEEELEVPDPMTVEFLEKVMGLSDDETAQARPMRAPAKDGTDSKVVYEIEVSAQDKDTDTSLSGTNIPTKIPMGWIEDAGITADVEVAGKHYTFCGVTVDDNPCVFIGQYAGTVYYSTDGVGAIALGGNDVVLNYWEYYEVTMSAVGTEVGDNLFATGTITVKDSSVDSEGNLGQKDQQVKNEDAGPASATVRVYKGEKLEWSVETDWNPATYAMYIVESIAVVENGVSAPSFTPDYEEQYDYEEKREITADTSVTVTFGERKKYRVFFDQTFLYGGEETPETNNLPNGQEFGEGAKEVTIGYFHTQRDQQIVSLKLNGVTVNLPDDDDIGSHSSLREPASESTEITIQGQNTKYTVKIEAYKQRESLNFNVWQYGYRITVTAADGIYGDLDFVPEYEQMEKSFLKLKLMVGDKENPNGVDIIHWNNGADPANPDDSYQMASTAASTRTTHFVMVKRFCNTCG